MYKLFHSGLQPPDLELHCHQLVGTHDGLMVVSPAFSQLPTARLLGLEVFRILRLFVVTFWNLVAGYVNKANFSLQVFGLIVENTVVASFVVFILGLYMNGEFWQEGTCVFCDGVRVIVPSLFSDIKYFGNNSSSPARQFAIEIDSLLGELSIAMMWVSEGFILHHLHAFSSVALLVAVLADHVQLPDLVLVHGERHADAIFLQQHGSGSRGPAGAREKKMGTRGWCTEVPLANAAEIAAVGAQEATPRSLELEGAAGEVCPALVVMVLSAGC